MTLPTSRGPKDPFGGWAGPHNPKMLIVGEAWGEQEAQTHQPFVGTSGLELWRMLGEALPDIAPELHSESIRDAYRYGNAWIKTRAHWLECASIAYTNVLNLRPPSNKLEPLCFTRKELGNAQYPFPPISRGLYLQPQYLPELDRLLSEIQVAAPNVVVAAGNTACWALLHATNIGAIRGSVTTAHPKTGLSHLKILPTYHPAGVLYQWSWRPIVIADLIKASRESLTPELVRPERQVLVNPTLDEVLEWTRHTLANPPPLLSCDIETIWGQIRCIGFARSPQEAIVVPFVAVDRSNGSYWPTPGAELNAWAAVRSLLSSQIPKLFQNGLFDLQYILKMGIKPTNLLHDTMLLHHSLFPELLKGLGFLGSIYTNEQSWKLMSRPKQDVEKRDE